jgi:hypothetical protein
MLIKMWKMWKTGLKKKTEVRRLVERSFHRRQEWLVGS